MKTCTSENAQSMPTVIEFVSQSAENMPATEDVLVGQRKTVRSLVTHVWNVQVIDNDSPNCTCKFLHRLCSGLQIVSNDQKL